MATVADKAFAADKYPSFVNPNRTNAGEPNGTITPQFCGEIILDTTNNTIWKALTTANNSWVTLTTPF